MIITTRLEGRYVTPIFSRPYILTVALMLQCCVRRLSVVCRRRL